MAENDIVKPDDESTRKRDRFLGAAPVQKYSNEELTRAASIRVESMISGMPSWMQNRARQRMSGILSDIVALVQGFNLRNPEIALSPDVVARGSDSVNSIVGSEVSEALPTDMQKIENRKRWIAELAAAGLSKDQRKALRAIFGESFSRHVDSGSGDARADSGTAPDAGYSYSAAAAAPSGAGDKFGAYTPPKEGWKEAGWQDWAGTANKNGASTFSTSAGKYSGIEGSAAAISLKEPGQKLNLEKVQTFKEIKTLPVAPGSSSPANMTPEEKEAFLNKVYGEDKKPESAAPKKTFGGEGDEVTAAQNDAAIKAAPSAPSGQPNYSMLSQRSKAGALHREALKNKEPDKAPEVAVKPDAAPAAKDEPTKPQANAMLHQRAKHHAPALTS